MLEFYLPARPVFGKNGGVQYHFRVVIFWGALVIGVLTGIYFLGKWQAGRQSKGNLTVEAASALPQKMTGPVAGSPTPSSPYPALTVAEARELFLDALAGKFPKGHTKVSTVIPFITFGVKPADIPALLAELQEVPDGPDRQELFHSLMGFFAQKDPSAALALIETLKDDKGFFNQAFGTALRTLAKANPQQALDYLAKLPPDDPSMPGRYRNIFETLGGANPAEALAFAAGFPPGPVHDAALKGLAVGWSLADPKAALDWAVSLPATETPVFNAAFLSNVALMKSPSLAAEYVDYLQDPAARASAIVSIASLWGAGSKKDPAAALDWLNTVATGEAYTAAVNAIFSTLAKKDPTVAAAALDKVTDPAARQASLTTLANSWGKLDPLAALTWAQSLQADTATQAGALHAIVTNWAKSDPVAVASYVQSSPNPSLYLSADPLIAQSLAASNPQAALAFANNIPEAATRNKAVNNTLVTLAQTDFNAAWANAIALPADGNRDFVMDNLVGVQAKKDPTKAIALIPLFPDEEGQTAATATIAKTWVALDPQAFTVWLDGLKPGSQRDTAIVQLVASPQATKDPAGVMAWVNTVSNPQTKASLVQQLSQAQAAEK